MVPCALSDIEAIANYIATDSTTYARNVVKKIVAATRILSRFPKAGGQVPEYQDPTVRELFAYSYRIIYKIEDEEALIVTVIHGKRNLSLARGSRFSLH